MTQDRPESDEDHVRPTSSAPPGTQLRQDASAIQTPEAARAVSEGGSLAPPGPPLDRYLGCTIDNRYKVEGVIGEGGMGVVYRCRHKIIDKRVAIKILRHDLSRDSEVTERFLMEAKAASAIHDEHIISISDFGQLPDGAAYFVMEYLEGTPLSEVASPGSPLPLGRLLHISLQLSEGLAAAHRMGIVHRDLKPDNVFLISRGRQVDFVKVLDFGIAKVSSSAEGRLTQVGSVFGTPHYMSPEQASGTPLDHRGDIYSLGVMLYELATGRVPFDAENFVGILSQQLYQEPVPPRAANPRANVPAELEAIILKCLEKKPEDRYQSMIELRDDLQSLEDSQTRASTPMGSGFSPEVVSSVDGSAFSTAEVELDRPRRWPMFAAFAAPLLVVGAFFLVRLGQTVPPRSEGAAAPPGPAAEVEAPRADAVQTDETKPELPSQVLLGATPASAHVFRDGVDLGETPVAIDVPAQARVEVEVRHPGYQPESLVLDGSSARVRVELRERAPGAGARKAKRGTRKPAARKKATRKSAEKAGTQPLGGQLFVEPWQKN